MIHFIRPRRVLQAVLCASLVALTACDKTKEKTQTGPAPSAVTPEAPTPMIATPAASAAPVNSVAMVTEGLSPSFRAVAARLELGACSFAYSETGGAGALAAFLDEMMKVLPPAERKDIPPGFSFVTLFKMLGLESVTATGSSSRQRADGSFHSVNFTHVPQGRKGLMTLTGGRAEKLLLLELAPKDTDLALEFPLNLKDFARDVMPGVIELLPAGERGKFVEETLRPLPAVGLNAKQILDKLDARVGLFLRLDTTQKIALAPNSPPLPGMDGVIVLDRLGWLFEALKPQFMPALEGAGSPATVSTDDGVVTIRMTQAAGPPPMDFQPVLRFDPKADRILMASRPALFDSVVAGTGKFSQGTDFASIWRDLPSEGNACLYVSPRLLHTISDGITASMTSAGSKSAGDTAIFQKMTDWLKPLMSRGQALVLANQTDGILTSANTSIPAGSSSLTAISTVGILAGLALPAYAKVREKAQETRDLSNLRQVMIALKIYATDHGGRYPGQLSELGIAGALPDGTTLEFTDATTNLRQPWLYNGTLTDSSPGTAAVLASPVTSKSGKRMVGFNDGSVRFVTEAEFKQAWAR